MEIKSNVLPRKTKIKLKTAKGRKISSTRWLQRQLNDPYVQQSRIDGYRSRAAYKLIEIHEKFSVFNKSNIVIDLGSCPGSWSQVAINYFKSKNIKNFKLIAVDLNIMDPIEGVEFIQGDFADENTLQEIIKVIGNNKVDLILSDMAPSSIGHAKTDHIRIMTLCEEAFYFAKDFLQKDGTFVAKILQGGAEKELLNGLKANFSSVKHYKPKASRADSAEIYIVAKGFKY
jgi:23S rRNA (uridine2552-2'-O)-methyltransferase